MSKPSDLGSLKIGSYILLPVGDQPTGEPCRISEYDTSKPGKQVQQKHVLLELVYLMEQNVHMLVL